MKVLIELPTWLGDTVMATPAIENLNNHFNDAKITLIGSSVAIEAIENHPMVVKTYILDNTYSSLYKVVKELNEFDVFFSFRGSLRAKFMKDDIVAKIDEHTAIVKATITDPEGMQEIMASRMAEVADKMGLEHEPFILTPAG